MKCSPVRSLMRLFLFLGLMPVCMGAPAQKVAPQVPTKPINLDRELEEQVKPDRAASYYHFSLAKWNEDKGDLAKAISEMRTALKYNPDSSSIYLEMATLLGKSGSIQEAMDHAQKAAELDPKDPIRTGCSPTFISGRRCGEIPLRRIFRKRFRNWKS